MASRWSAYGSTSTLRSHVSEVIALTGMTDLTIMLGNRWLLNVATQVVGGVRTLTQLELAQRLLGVAPFTFSLCRLNVA